MRFILVLLTVMTVYTSYGQSMFYTVPILDSVDVQKPVKYTMDHTKLKSRDVIISNFVTKGEYKRYLKSIKADSSDAYYKTQIPSGDFMDPKDVSSYMSNDDFDDEPVLGISWTAAVNYGKWLTRQENREFVTHYYRLPYVSEWIAMNNHHSAHGIVSDINQNVSDWTLNAYIESPFEFRNGKLGSDYTYDARPSDPKAMKRKHIFGRSFHYEFAETDVFKRVYGYQDSSYRHVGFRLVRVIQPEKLSRGHLNMDYDGALRVKGYSLSNKLLPKSYNNSIHYNVINNSLNGTYRSFYTNGNLKSEGLFMENQRFGIWSVFDSTGQLVVQRNYTNAFDFDFIYPTRELLPSQQFWDKKPYYKLDRNKEGYYPYFDLQERAYKYSIRHWVRLDTVNTSSLFKSDFNDYLIKAVLNGRIKAYHHRSDLFKYEIGVDSVNLLYDKFLEAPLCAVNLKVDFFIDDQRIQGEKRIIGLQLVIKTTNGEKPLFWLYYPEIRPLLADQPYSSDHPDVKNLEDWFFFQCYRGDIYKQSNMYDMLLMSSGKVSEDVEFQILEEEHRYWVLYNR